MRLTPRQREFLEAAVAAGGDVGAPPLTTTGRRLDVFVVGGRAWLRHDSAQRLVSLGLLEAALKPGTRSTARLPGAHAYHLRVTQAGRDAVAARARSGAVAPVAA